MMWCFPIWYFLKCCPECIYFYVSLGTFFNSLQFFFNVGCPLGLHAMFFLFQKYLIFLHRIFHLFSCFFHRFVIKFFLRCFRRSFFCLYCLMLSLYLLSFASFINIFGLISFSCMVSLSWCFLFSVFSYNCVSVCFFLRLFSQCVVVYFSFFSAFACFRSIFYLSFELHFRLSSCISVCVTKGDSNIVTD